MEIPLFDNDLTLTRLKSGINAHDGAFDFALREVYGLKNASKNEIDGHGKIDPQIITEVLRLHNVPEEQIEAKMEQAMSAMVSYFIEHKNEGEFEAIPHVKEILIALKEQNIPRGVLTGNIEGIGWLKLEQAGIRDLLQFGAFGNLARKRVDLIEVAAKRAKEAGIELEGNELVIVGDTPLDVACAKQGGIKSVAVAIGTYPEEELRKTNPDLLIASFEEKDKFINFLLRK